MKSFSKFLEDINENLFVDVGNVRIYGGNFKEIVNFNTMKYSDHPRQVPGDKLLDFIASQGRSVRFIIIPNGKVIIGDSPAHSFTPGYNNKFSIHGSMAPSRKELQIVNVSSEINMTDFFQNLSKYLNPGLESLIQSKIIDKNWIFIANGIGRTTVSEIMSRNQQPNDEEKSQQSAQKMQQNLEREGQNIIRQHQYKQKQAGIKDPNYFYPRENFKPTM